MTPARDPHGMPMRADVEAAAAEILATTPLPAGYPATGRAVPHREWTRLLRRAVPAPAEGLAVERDRAEVAGGAGRDPPGEGALARRRVEAGGDEGEGGDGRRLPAAEPEQAGEWEAVEPAEPGDAGEGGAAAGHRQDDEGEDGREGVDPPAGGSGVGDAGENLNPSRSGHGSPRGEVPGNTQNADPCQVQTSKGPDPCWS